MEIIKREGTKPGWFFPRMACWSLGLGLPIGVVLILWVSRHAGFVILDLGLAGMFVGLHGAQRYGKRYRWLDPYSSAFGLCASLGLIIVALVSWVNG